MPDGTMVRAPNGDLYGTTSGGSGTIFKITPTGTLTTLYTFCQQTGCADGSSPDAGLVDATDGDFYGTTFYGGVNGSGTVFKITPGGPLTTLYSFCWSGAASVSFNGTPAVFTIVTPSEITTTVPTGASRRKIQVALPRLTLSSNVPFRVLP